MPGASINNNTGSETTTQWWREGGGSFRTHTWQLAVVVQCYEAQAYVRLGGEHLQTWPAPYTYLYKQDGERHLTASQFHMNWTTTITFILSNAIIGLGKHGQTSTVDR